MIQFNQSQKIAFISSFPSRRYGIATFASDLIQHTYRVREGALQPIVIAMQSDLLQQYDESAECVIRKDVISSYKEAADFINSRDTGTTHPEIIRRQVHSYIDRLPGDGTSLNRMKQRAYQYGRAMTWPKIGRACRGILTAGKLFLCTSVRPQLSLQAY